MYEKYTEFDKRIQLVSNEQNMQIFASRMKAIDYIKGEYVLFLDGDDYLDLDFVRHMHDFLIYKDADIVVCNFAFVIENSLFIEQKSKFKKLEYTKEDNLLNFLFETHAASYSQNLN
ncbi:glycosyltransferase [bacterium]|nr:glycosyltransferase [bacterium]